MTPPRAVVVEGGTHLVDNLGDIVMLQALAARLRARWPQVRIQVPTQHPERLARHCPEAEPLPAMGRYRWLPEPPEGGAARLYRAARRGPVTLARAATRLERRRSADPDVRALLTALLDADAFVLGGRGGTTDAFLGDGLQALALTRAALDLGLPSAALGQGVGPATDPALLARARAVFPRLDVVAVRERLEAPPLLAALGVDPDRVALTGDDAVCRALPAGGPAAGAALGVNVRAADYAGVDAAQVEALGAAVRAAAARLDAPTAGLPIALGGDEPDAAAIARATGGAPSDVDDVDGLVERIRGCRAVVAGSYHAAVLSLAAGVPVVAVWASEYYRRKLEGAAAEFGPGCTVLPIAGQDLGGRLGAAIEVAWHAGPEVRAGLVAAGRRQAAAGQAAFERFAERVEAR